VTVLAHLLNITMHSKKHLICSAAGGPTARTYSTRETPALIGTENGFWSRWDKRGGARKNALDVWYSCNSYSIKIK